mgnify:CR=1 FL=1
MQMFLLYINIRSHSGYFLLINEPFALTTNGSDSKRRYFDFISCFLFGVSQKIATRNFFTF